MPTDTPPRAPHAASHAASPSGAPELSPVDAPPSPAESPQIGLSVKRGMTWSVGNTVLAKFLSFMSIAILGLLLSQGDYGLYGISFSIAAFVQIFRDGGVPQLLVQRGESEYHSLRGPVFWMALAFNLATGGLLALLAPLLSLAYDEPGLLGLLLIIGLAMPLATPGVVLQARLAMQLRFGTIARIQLISAFIRYGGTIALAWLGFGPFSIVLPLPVIAVYESVAAYLATGDAPWRSPPRLSLWPSLLKKCIWIIFSALATASLNQGSYLALGMLVEKSLVGVFFLAYQLITQIDALLAATAGSVLFPALSRLAAEHSRFRAAVVRSSRVMMFLAAPATAAMLAGFDAFEDVLWHNRWDAAVWPVQALSLLYAARVLFMVPSTALMAQGRFLHNAVIVLICGAGMTLATTTGAYLNPTPGSIGVWLGAYIGFGCLVFTLVAMHTLGVSAATTFSAIMPAWGASWLAAAAALALDAFLRPRLLPSSGTALDWLARSGWAIPFEAASDAPARISDAFSTGMTLLFALVGVLRLSLIALVMGVVYAGVLRAIFPTCLREGLHLAPMRFHRLLDRAFCFSRS